MLGSRTRQIVIEISSLAVLRRVHQYNNITNCRHANKRHPFGSDAYIPINVLTYTLCTCNLYNTIRIPFESPHRRRVHRDNN